VRARWRKPSAFGVLLLYAVLLAGTMAYLYATSTHSFTTAGMGADQQMKQMGHQLFILITVMQTAVWMLIAPSLTAPAIAGERERGLLEGLQLSELTPLRILQGKLASALSFLLLMLVVSLPVTSVCFILGGVSAGDFLIAAALQFVTALTGAIIGLYFSARSHRTFGALRATFVAMMIWGCGSAWAADNSWYWARSWSGASVLDMVYSLVGTAFGYTNPFLAAHSLSQTRPNPFPPGSLPAQLTSFPHWLICITLELLMAALLLRMAARALRKPLPEPRWVERKRWLNRLRSVVAPPPATTSAPQSIETPTPPPELRQRAGQALMREFPIEKLARFTNPVLQREVRSKFRLRQGSNWMLLFQILLGLTALICYLYAGFLTTDEAERAGTWWLLSHGGLIAVMVVTAIMGAGAFSREREAGTWESLSLSLLSPREIIFGKVLAPLMMCGYGFVLFLPVLLPCALLPRTNSDLFGDRALTAAMAVLIVAVAAWCCTAWGLLLSWLCRRTAIAISWTLVTVFLGFVVLPIFVRIVISLTYGWFGAWFLGRSKAFAAPSPLFEMLASIWHPWMALERLQGYENWNSNIQAAQHAYWNAPGFIGCFNVTVNLAIGALLLLRLSILIKRETRAHQDKIPLRLQSEAAL